MSNPYSALGPNDYLGAGQMLLPRGLAWPRGADKTLTAYVAAIGVVQAGVQATASELVDVELNPFLTEEMLPDWEADFGLPDPCVPQPQTYQQRIAALLARIADPGGFNPSRFVALAASIGFPITVYEYRPFRVGQGRAGDPLCNQPWIYAWRVNAPETNITSVFRCTSPCTDPLRSWGNPELECLINSRNRASRIVFFAYGGA